MVGQLARTGMWIPRPTLAWAGQSAPHHAHGKRGRATRKRRGSATIDYFLLVGVLLPLAAIVWWFGPRAIHAVYDMSTVMIGWPFM
jgi:hypothetical protein